MGLLRQQPNCTRFSPGSDIHLGIVCWDQGSAACNWQISSQNLPGGTQLCDDHASRAIHQPRSETQAEGVRPPLPPFTPETAKTKVQMAEDAWNSRDPDRVAAAYTPGEWEGVLPTCQHCMPYARLPCLPLVFLVSHFP